MFQAFALGSFIFWTRLIFVLLGLWLSTEFFLRLAHSANLSLQHFREHGLWYVAAFLLGEDSSPSSMTFRRICAIR